MVMTARFVLCLLLCWNLREEDGGAPRRWLDWLASLASGIAGFGCQAWDVQTAWRQTQCKAMVWSVWWKSHLKRFGKTFSVSSLVVRGIKLEMNHHGDICAQKNYQTGRTISVFFPPAICIYLIFQDQNLGFSFFFNFPNHGLTIMTIQHSYTCFRRFPILTKLVWQVLAAGVSCTDEESRTSEWRIRMF